MLGGAEAPSLLMWCSQYRGHAEYHSDNAVQVFFYDLSGRGGVLGRQHPKKWIAGLSLLPEACTRK